MTRGRVLLILLLVVGVAAGVLAGAAREAASASLHVLDVGQGDALLLRAGSVDVMVDGGPDGTVLQRLGALRPAWDRTLEVIVLTHPQRDHLAGMLPVLERERVSLVLLPEVPADSDLFRAFVEVVVARGVPVRFARAGQELRIGPLMLTVLAPDARTLALGRRNANNGAVVLRADVADAFSALLTADIERPAEHLLVQRWPPETLDVDVLKIPHHGSKTSTTLRLLRASTPSLALVSVGAGNRFGHPHPSVLGRLRAVTLRRTDLHGTISLRVRDGAITLACTRGCKTEPLARP